MLLNINITDLAVVKSLDLDFSRGMSVLTGETGAGKSILLTALGLALGDRADSGYIRPDCQRAEVNLEFALDDAPLARQWLLDNELDTQEQCLIRRIISQDGRSKAYINNRPTTLQALQGLSEKLVEIHGQHAHLALLHGDEQRRMLDSFANQQQQVEQINAVYRQWRDASMELDTLKQAGRDQTEREELLRFQIEELQLLGLDNYDYVALSEEHDRQANLGHILSSGQGQLECLYDNEQQSVSHILAHSVNELRELTQFAPDLKEITDLLTEAQIQVQEAAQQLRRFLDAQELDPQRLEWLASRIGTIQSLSRKHQVPPEDIPDLAVTLLSELDNLTHSTERIGILQETVQQLQDQYQKLARQLSQSRGLGAKKLQTAISKMIRELGMPQGEFSVRVSPLSVAAPKLNGLDKIEFLVSANPGLPAKPLAKVASGGELSRISLAIQVVTSHDKTTPTMIFDEVDSGIGGGIAEIVGKRLRTLSSDRQVLCVTHLPQVAAQANQHLFVEKSNQTNTTSSNVRSLDRQQRVAEVARMLGGVNMTENTLAHAREMLETGNQA